MHYQMGEHAINENWWQELKIGVTIGCSSLFGVATAGTPIATPADWPPGQDVIVALLLNDGQAEERFGALDKKLPYLRFAKDPSQTTSFEGPEVSGPSTFWNVSPRPVDRF